MLYYNYLFLERVCKSLLQVMLLTYLFLKVLDYNRIIFKQILVLVKV
jgi:hypothetical protein